MGGRPRFLGDALHSYTCTGSALDVMDYGLAGANEFSNELTARMLLLQHFFATNTRKLHLNLYKYTKVYCAPARSNNTPQMFQQDH